MKAKEADAKRLAEEERRRKVERMVHTQPPPNPTPHLHACMPT